MDLSWISELLKLLFGNLGAIGTIAVVFCGFLAYMLHIEQKEHACTREKNEVLNEKRYVAFEKMVVALIEQKAALDRLTELLTRKR